MAKLLKDIHSVQSIIDARSNRFTYEKLFSGENGSINPTAIKPFYCGGCLQAEVRAVPATPRTRAYIALIDASKSDHASDCCYDYTKRATTIYSGTTYTRIQGGKYILDLFSSSEALAEHLATQQCPREVDRDYRHLPKPKAKQVRALNTYLHTVTDVLKLLRKFNYDPEVTINFQAYDKSTRQTYQWDEIYYDLDIPNRATTFANFLLDCHKSGISTPPLIVSGTIKSIWEGPKYVLTTSHIEKNQGLQAFIWPPKDKRPPADLTKGKNILIYGHWKLYINKDTNTEIRLKSGACRATSTWSHLDQLVELTEVYK